MIVSEQCVCLLSQGKYWPNVRYSPIFCFKCCYNLALQRIVLRRSSKFQITKYEVLSNLGYPKSLQQIIYLVYLRPFISPFWPYLFTRLSRYQIVELKVFGSFGLSTKEPCAIMLRASSSS